MRKADGWHLRLMLEEIPMPWNWPVETNYHEAKAFCNWKAARSGDSAVLQRKLKRTRLISLPVFGLLGFLGATAGGLWLVWTIWRSGGGR